LRQVALISQTLRAAHCLAYLRPHLEDVVVLTSDPSAFDESGLEGSLRVVTVSPPPELLPSTRLTEGRWYRSVLRWARSGSGLGRWLERTVKRLLWRLRYVDRIVVLRRSTRPRDIDPDTIRTSAMYTRLAEEHGHTPIDRIVVFDVFDLPVALAFGDDHGVEVWVR
jgi:hypothetical protein